MKRLPAFNGATTMTDGHKILFSLQQLEKLNERSVGMFKIFFIFISNQNIGNSNCSSDSLEGKSGTSGQPGNIKMISVAGIVLKIDFRLN